jgi:carboxyl-terminal processing protease
MNKTVRNVLLVFLTLFLLVGSFSGGFLVGWLIPTASSTVNSLSNEITNSANGSSSDTSLLFKPFWQAWDIVHENYIDQPVDDLLLMQGAIRGMVDAIGDAHTLYMTPEEYTSNNESVSGGNYGGIGAYVNVDSEYLTIEKPMSGSPAERAGLQAGDQVIAVDGNDVTGVDPNEVLKSVKGTAGTTVTLTIHRPDPESTFDVEITREVINVPTVSGQILKPEDLPAGSNIVLDQKIGYIYLTTFGDNTASELQSILSELLAENPKGLILDLRYNSGGYLETAIDVISQFIDSGVIVYEQDSSGNLTPYRVRGVGQATDIPLVVLVNEYSASASEITAGAIQDFGRGVLVGTTTYGKGSVQYWLPLDNNQGAVSVTVARWLTPNKRQINGIGLTPDYEVNLTDEDINTGNDLQLIKAVEILLQGE